MKPYLRRAAAGGLLLATFTAGYALGHPAPPSGDELTACISRIVRSDSPQQA